MEIVVLVEYGWEPGSIEFDPRRWEVDWSRALALPGPGSLDAVELGLRLGQVTVASVGEASTEEVLRTALAMGATQAVRAPSLSTLLAFLADHTFDILLAPWRSTHGGANPWGPLIAGYLDLPHATAVDQLLVEGDRVRVRRRLDRGAREVLLMPMPAVVALEPGILSPRQPSPAALLEARAASIPTLNAPGRDSPQPVLLGYQPPRPRPPRVTGPDPDANAEDRIAAVVGTRTPHRPRRLITGSPEELAEQVLQFLAERSYL